LVVIDGVGIVMKNYFFGVFKMKRLELKMMLVCTLILLVGIGPAALGDWDEGGPHKMHYPQLPDLDLTGMDVLTGPRLPDIAQGDFYEKFLADDWQCSRSGLVTDIHIWGSYNEDIRLILDPYFNLVIYENIPADPCYPFSRPGQVLSAGIRRPGSSTSRSTLARRSCRSKAKFTGLVCTTRTTSTMTVPSTWGTCSF
jgi:hypothetical protein